MDYKKSKAPKTTVTRDMNELASKVGNVYEAVAIIGKRANQIGTTLKRELDAKLQDFSMDRGDIEETFENKEQIEISRSYEVMPKPTLIATQELMDDQIVCNNGSRDDMLK
jgi:DNA-directed RNA polymerase subunit K/omega